MKRCKRTFALLLAWALLLSLLPVSALATEAEDVPMTLSETTETSTEATEAAPAAETEATTCTHSYGAVVTEPTCKDGGFTTHTCSLCGGSYTDTLTDPTGVCTVIPVAEVPATCQTEGTAAHYACAVCGKQYLDEKGETPARELTLPKAEHAFGSWEVTEFPGPELTGAEVRQCANCDAQESREIPALTCELAAPKLSVKVESATGKPVLSWKAVEGAEGYVIYRAAASEEAVLLTAVTELKVTDTTAVPGQQYTYGVMALSETAYSQLSGEKTALCKCAKPAISISREDATGKPVISWETVEGAVRYDIYRSADSKKNFKKIASTQELSAVISGTSVGQKYYYKVKAVCANEDANSSYSATKSYVTDCAQPVAAVTGGASSGIKISWGKISGAKKYEVYRASSENGEWTRIKTTSSRSYTDQDAPKNQVSYYKVSAYGASTTSRSAYSAPVSLMNHTFGSWQTIVPSSPEAEGWKERTCSHCGHVEGVATPVLQRSLTTPKLTVKANSSTGKPTLSWESVKGASTYYIYLVDAATGERTYLGETGSRKFTHLDARIGESYSYQIIAVSATKCSKYSAVKSVVCKCPKPAITVASEPVTGKPVVSWEAVEGAVSYALYCSTSKDEGFKLAAETTELSVLVNSASAGKTYYYRLKAVGPTEGSTSANSSTVKYVTDCAQPQIAVSSGKSGGIKISWEKVSGAKKYEVYRASSENGEWTKIKTTSSGSYTDKEAPQNQTSWYKVRAYGSSTASRGAFSQVLSQVNHTFGAWRTVQPSTPEAEGVKARTCSSCGHVETAATPVLARTLGTPELSVTAENATGTPLLSWSKVNNATEYWIYLHDAATGSDTFLLATDSRSFRYADAIAGNSYAFRVMAVSSSACGNYSAVKAVTAKCAVPQLQIATDTETGIQTLTWEPVAGAAGYDIYRSTVKTSGYELYDFTAESSMLVACETPGLRYYYKIQAVHSQTAAANSLLSEACYDRTNTGDFYVYAGRISDKCNKVTWEPVAGAKEYHVLRSTSLDGKYKEIATVQRTDYTDLTVKADTVYYYMVTAEGKNLSEESAVYVADSPSKVPIKIYLSPSCQTENWYAYGKTSEAKQCRAIAQLGVEALERCGFAALTNVTDDMDERMAESNAWSADLHVPIHSNAYNESAMGTQIYHDGATNLSQSACKAIYKVLAPLTPGTSAESYRGYPGLYEIKHSNAPTAYIEVAFHDTKTEAKWIINNKEKIAEAICKGICNLYGVEYIAP